MNRFVLSTLLVMSVGALAPASTDYCSSADQRLKTVHSAPDGGAPIGPSYTVSLDGKVVYSHSPHGGAELRLVKIEKLGEPIVVGHKKTSKFDTTYATQELKVTSLADGSVLFQDFVLCTRSRYIGPPIPSTPRPVHR